MNPNQVVTKLNLLVFVFYKKLLYFNQHSWRDLWRGLKTKEAQEDIHLRTVRTLLIMLNILIKDANVAYNNVVMITSFLMIREDMILSTTAASSSLGFS